MDALLFLLAAWLLTLGARHWPPAALVAVPLAALGGTTLPDLDLALGLGHRSGLTHSLLLPVVLACQPRWWPVAAGLALGVGLHLSADCFPNGMRGFATVKLPGAGSIGAGWSYVWLAVNAVASLALGAWVLARETSVAATAAVLGAVVAIGVGYLWVTDGGWPALLVFTGAGWAVVRRRR
ncbi:hypothetical protein [Sphingomonas sp.]|uniref:hypothetical protein n=1 Tax=Sphingomonas sp. TaxID=28214 RepID=UPI0035BBC250